MWDLLELVIHFFCLSFVMKELQQHLEELPGGSEELFVQFIPTNIEILIC